MAIPKYQEMYLAFLQYISDGKEYDFKNIKDYVADEMHVTDDERKELLPSGKQTMYGNRIAWTKTYLNKAGLIDSPKRGIISITPKGLALLAEKPEKINDDLLMRYDSFREFKNPVDKSQKLDEPNDLQETPQDQIDNAFKLINSKLSDELLSEILKQTPDFFEALVVKLLQEMGYGGALASAGVVVGKSGDEGIDGIIREDKLGFNMIYIQAKRWAPDKTVGRPEIQRFVGALADKKRGKGLFITTAKFSKEAIGYAEKQQIILIDGEYLTKLMIEHNLGVSIEKNYAIKQIDTDFFYVDD